MYKVGMKVRINPNLVVTSQSFQVVEEMVEYRGEIATITAIDRDIHNLDIDRGSFNWDKRWFSPYVLNKGER